MLVKDFYEILWEDYTPVMNECLKQKDSEGVQRCAKNLKQIKKYMEDDISKFEISLLNGPNGYNIQIQQM